MNVNGVVVSFVAVLYNYPSSSVLEFSSRTIYPSFYSWLDYPCYIIH